MTEILHIVDSNLDPDRSLKDSWEQFASNLRAAGSGGDQIDAMEMAFYMGAAQVFMSIDKAAKIGMPELAAVMKQIYRDVDVRMQKNAELLRTEGNA